MRAVAFVRHLLRGSLWLIVLGPILGISAYSLFYVARHLGVPPYFAWAMSICFDGLALLAADFSLKYAQEGLSGTAPRTAVRVFAVLAAFLQTLHARIGHEPTGSWILWASLPIGAVVVYELHTRWERRKALAAAGVIYPAPLPAFGVITWFLFPFATLTSLRKIVGERKTVIETAARNRPTLTVVADRPKRKAVTADRPKALTSDADRPKAVTGKRSDGRETVRKIRAWAKDRPDICAEIGWTWSDRARLPQKLVERYWAIQAEERAAGDGAERGEAV